MSFGVRPADLVHDKAVIVETLRCFLNPRSDDKRFEWLYRENPFGEASVWLAYEGEPDQIVGVAGAFPRRLHMLGRQKLSWVLGDFCVSDQHRTLGPALMLQRACLSGFEKQGVPLCYDFPSAAMMAVYRRLRLSPFQRLLRLAKPLRVDRKFKTLFGDSVASRALAQPANLLLRLAPMNNRGNQGIEVALHGGGFGAEFTALSERIGDRYGIAMHRSADYLNWRYRAHPLSEFEVVTGGRNGRLLGYAIYQVVGADGYLLDLFGDAESGVLAPLVADSVASMRRHGAETVSASLVEGHPWRKIFHDQGFKLREESPMIVAMTEDLQDSVAGTPWLFMSGDRDS
jgi:hypothetical protein